MSHNTACEVMERYSSTPVGAPSLPCQHGNRLWLENLSGRNASVSVTVGRETSQLLPQTSSDFTLLPNTLAGSTGPISIAINGQTCGAVEGLRPELLTRPEDVAIGIVAGRARTAPNPLRGADRGIPVQLNAADADLSQFLPDGLTPENTEIDMVFVGAAADGPGMMRPGTHNIDDTSDAEAEWLARSLISNTISTVSTESAGVISFGLDVRRSNPGQVRAALKEVIWEGRFYVKRISSWGGKLAIIFKGAVRSRSFLTAISYGLRNSKMSYLNSYALGVDAVQNPSLRSAGRVATSAAKGNLIGFAISSMGDIQEFMTSEDPERNWGELLASLGVNFVKVWLAGFTGAMIAAALAAGALSGAPVILVVAIGAAFAIGAGVGLDFLDRITGFKTRAREMGRAFGHATDRCLNAALAFVEKISADVETIINGWFQSFSNNLRQRDPNGWCALFCAGQMDQLRAWQRGLTGRSSW